MPGGDLAQLRLIWQRAGRPGAAKLKDAAKRQGLNLTVKEVKEFVIAEAVAQVYQPAPRSEGKITSPELNARWMCDLIDYKTRSPEKNDGYRLVLICIDVFSRFVYVEPLKTKEQEEVTQAFQRIQRAAQGRVVGKRRVIPSNVTTDAGAEFKGPFSEYLEKQGISQEFKEAQNSMAVVDAAIRTIKTSIAKEMVENESDSWVKALPNAVKAYNENSHTALMKSAPQDVKGSTVLQYELEKQSGFAVKHNADLNDRRIAKLREMDAFRVLAPKSTWVRADQPRYGEKVHPFQMIFGTDVVSTDGTVSKVRDAMAVASGSANVAVPRELKTGRPIRDEGAKAALRPFATALRGWLGPGGEESLTLQGAGTKLRGLEGFAEVMTEQRITGIGALMRFLELFPEFEVIGRAPRASVRLKP